MRRVGMAIIAAATMLTAACGSSPETEVDMKTLTFDGRQAECMTLVACHEARGDQSLLALAIDEGLEAGLTLEQMKEALSQLYAYTGFPRSLNALGTLQRVLEERGNDSLATDEGRPSSELPSNFDALRRGTEVQTMLVGAPFDYQFCPSEDYYLKSHLFGDIFARDAMTYADREYVTVSALCGLEGVMPQLVSHVKGAQNMGVSSEQLLGIVASLRKAGLEAEAARCEAAMAMARGEEAQTLSPSVWPIGQPNDAYAAYFTGQSYLAVMDGGLCNVSFEPGCRNFWHIHHGAVQVLVCVSGRGWYQEWGKEAVELRPGVTVAVPAGVKHWHGAAADSWMQHLTYHTDMRPGNRTEWLEPVDDQTYNTLR